MINTTQSSKIFFYPHSYMRDRMLDTIRFWPSDQVINPEIAYNREGGQVPPSNAIADKTPISWKQRFPLLNIKCRPGGAPKNSLIYVWGALMLSGKFIVDIDNPWCFVGYNIRAMVFYKSIIKCILISKRCLEIRCMSEACRGSIKHLFGDDVYRKSKVHYPIIKQYVSMVPDRLPTNCRFLFVGTQFEIKGGEAMINAFNSVHSKFGACTLDIVTHLPNKFVSTVERVGGIRVHEAKFTRSEIYNRFMLNADVLLFPTYGESFGMVVLEAISHGLAIITTDIYALREMVHDGCNGVVLQPPISVWNGFLPSRFQYDWAKYKDHVRGVNSQRFQGELELAIERFVVDKEWRLAARNASIQLMQKSFENIQ